ncbi:beta-lactamase hydrolase domain-containing protein [Tundrisphaera lichenicola]|uniref:beta-lactamase hydrolase domain-containing protein n=1 Tax=Tundrisphaera lichenicola TaxID=2029860 RepID=UPI003EBCDF66
MFFERAITPKVSIGDQPTVEDLARLKAEGYTGIVNLRNDGEPDQPLGIEAEGQEVRALGLNYLHVGVGGSPLTEAGVHAVSDFIEGQEKVMVHCRKGGRAAALVLIHQAKVHGWSAAEAAARGRGLGLEVDGGLRSIVENYLDDHRAG